MRERKHHKGSKAVRAWCRVAILKKVRERANLSYITAKARNRINRRVKPLEISVIFAFSKPSATGAY